MFYCSHGENCWSLHSVFAYLRHKFKLKMKQFPDVIVSYLSPTEGGVESDT